MQELVNKRQSQTELRRAQILEAACACVRGSGFHGASMAEIAKAAQLSVGQIYRYFENKEAIIAAIVDLDYAEMREKFGELNRSGRPLVEAIAGEIRTTVDRFYDPDRAALGLEVLAEAARNPRVGAIVRDADVEQRKLALGLVAATVPAPCGDAEIAARSEVLSFLFEGMMARAVSHPEADRDDIAQVFAVVLRHLLSHPPIFVEQA